jgi:hypothetical protein
MWLSLGVLCTCLTALHGVHGAILRGADDRGVITKPHPKPATCETLEKEEACKSTAGWVGVAHAALAQAKNPPRGSAQVYVVHIRRWHHAALVLLASALQTAP